LIHFLLPATLHALFGVEAIGVRWLLANLLRQRARLVRISEVLPNRLRHTTKSALGIRSRVHQATLALGDWRHYLNDPIKVYGVLPPAGIAHQFVEVRASATVVVGVPCLCPVPVAIS
jgi:hypothetical protein